MKEAFAYIRKHQMIKPGDRIIAGVSGGADSVCLLLVLLEYQKEVDFALKVVHIEHGIRGEVSKEDAAFVESLCKEKGIPFECFSYDIPAIAHEKRMTTEETGRMMRYQTFEECCRAWNGNRIAIAHNQNDQAETMLWNMIRGSGVKGSAGIRPVRDKIIRPLLSCRRQEIETWLNSRGQSWREDATNQEDGYTRNLIRRQILPLMEEKLNERAVEHFFQLSEELQETESYLEGETMSAFARCVTIQNGKAEIDLTRFQEEAAFLQRRVIRRCLEEAGCGLKDITREHIGMIQRLGEMDSGKMVQLPGNWIAQREFSKLVIKREMSRKEEAEALPEIPLEAEGVTVLGNARIITRIFPYENQQIPQKRYTKWLDYDKIKDGLVVRSRRPKDYLIADSQGSRKKIKSYFTEAKIPVSERKVLPLICRGQEVFWVIGYRIGETGKISSDTRYIIEIEYKEER